MAGIRESYEANEPRYSGRFGGRAGGRATLWLAVVATLSLIVGGAIYFLPQVW